MGTAGPWRGGCFAAAMSLLLFAGQGLPAAPAGKTALKLIQGDLRPVNGESVVFKATPQGDLKMSLYFPKDWAAGERRAAIVCFSGGGFIAGGPAQFTGTAKYFASRRRS